MKRTQRKAKGEQSDLSIGYIHGSKLEPFSPPSFCQSGAGLEEYAYYYQKGYRRVTGKPYYAPEQKPERIAA